MAKKKTEDAAMATPESDAEVKPADLGDDAEGLPADHPLANDPALADAESAAGEIARLRAENARLKASAGPSFESGRRYLVKLQDALSWVVEPESGEHPFEAFKRATGVSSSAHAPEIHPTELPVGRVAA